MKKVLSLMAGMVFVLAFGMACADGTPPGSMDTGDKMIRNDDIQKYDHDQGQGTFNVMPAVPEETGSAAGGSGESDPTRINDGKEKPAPVEKDMTTPADTGIEPYRY
jgi:hypothetical protein